MGKRQQRGVAAVIFYRCRSDEPRLHQFSLAKCFGQRRYLAVKQLHTGVVRGQWRRADVPDGDTRDQRRCWHLGPGHRLLFARFTGIARPELTVLRRGQWRHWRNIRLEVQRGSTEHCSKSPTEFPVIGLL